MASITAIILTKNEEKLIASCINAIKGICEKIVVVDSYSTDKTVSIAEELGAVVVCHEFINYSKQYQYAVEYAQVKTTWILRIDADEIMTEQSSKELNMLCNKYENDESITGIVLRFANIFMGRKIKHGGVYPWRKLSVYKNGFGAIEQREMDEHILLSSGKTINARIDSNHFAFKGLKFLIDKSNWYSTREMIDYYQIKKSTRENASFKSRLKMNVYYKLPLGFRAKLYYWYRYYLRLGFLDGTPGKIYFFLVCYWYRFLVDAKIYEQKINPIELHSIGELK